MNILLVDDSKTMRTIQKTALASVAPGVTFGEAADGLEALKVIAATPGGFNLALVDWNMPNMSGLELVAKVRQTDRKTPIIMVTTEGERERIVEALKAGANNYMLKPFKADELLAKVQQTLAKAAA